MPCQFLRFAYFGTFAAEDAASSRCGNIGRPPRTSANAQQQRSGSRGVTKVLGRAIAASRRRTKLRHYASQARRRAAPSLLIDLGRPTPQQIIAGSTASVLQATFVYKTIGSRNKSQIQLVMIFNG
jgi:hypothetical protein